MKFKFLKTVTVIITLISTTSALFTCRWLFYQPREPKCIRRLS
ncbi:MAG: cyclic lactone autoinducer peptide [Clostridia bacterium]|nr:cyclic lactone autoinducer peptide [Clostridia bacterium]